jgi:hypothetical protein
VSISDEVRKLVGDRSAAHKRLVQYVVRQLKAGRDLDEILEDPYVTNRLSTIDRRALLDEPAVIAAASSEVLEGMRSRLESALGGAA